MCTALADGQERELADGDDQRQLPAAVGGDGEQQDQAGESGRGGDRQDRQRGQRRGRRASAGATRARGRPPRRRSRRPRAAARPARGRRWSRRPAVPNPTAARNRALSMIHWRRERRAGATSPSSGAASLRRVEARALIPISIGRAAAARTPDRSRWTSRLRSHHGRPSADCEGLPEANAGTCVIAPIRAPTQETPMLTRLAHLTFRHRWPVIGAWLVLTALRWLRRRQGLDALVPEHRRPRQAGVRGEPANAEDARRRRPHAERRRLPHERRRDEEHGDRAGDAACRSGDARRAHELVLLDREPRLRLGRPAHGVRRGVSGRPGPARSAERRRGDARRGGEGPAGRHHRQRHRPRRAGRSERRATRAAARPSWWKRSSAASARS